ncbi:MAG: transglutaminase domain-containing protein [Planctomycetes bacterium]|nr:transglutaminase domain-containing protein [Planctomycetota bacterium]
MPTHVFATCRTHALPLAVTLVAGTLWLFHPSAHAGTFEPESATAKQAEVAPESVVTRKDTYIVEMEGQPAGTSVTTESREGANIATRSEMKFSLRRGEVEIKILVQTEFIETADGKPISMKSRQVLASLPKEETYTFGDQEVTIVTSAMGKPITTTKPLPPGGWLTPAKATRTAREMAKKGEEKIVFSTIDPSNGLNVVQMERTRDKKEKIKVGGQEVDARKWNTAVVMSTGMRIESAEWVDEDGELLRSSMSFGGISMNLVRAAEADSGRTFKGPELMVNLFVKPDKPINDPRRSKMMTYVLRVKDGELPDLPSEAGQTFTRIDASSATVAVNAVQSALAPGKDHPESLKEYLDSSSMIDARDEKIAELASAAVKDVPAGQMAARAEALRRAVYQHINKKALDVGFGSASETARSGVGDCSEHGVLLAAMLRQQGIPARVVAGLIYADQFAGERGIFGYHMWTQALIEKNGGKRWVDLDATLPPGTPSDATHIAVSVTALADGELQSSMMNLMPLLGRLEIEVQNAVATPREKTAPKPQPAGTR